MASDNVHARALTLTDAVGALVVAGDGDVDELGGGVNVAEGDDGDVGVTALGDGLVVADDQQTQGKRSYRESHLFGGNRKYEKNKKFTSKL